MVEVVAQERKRQSYTKNIPFQLFAGLVEAGEKLSGLSVRKILNLTFAEMFCGAFSDLEMSSTYSNYHGR